jgi:hypothetical protein
LLLGLCAVCFWAWGWGKEWGGMTTSDEDDAFPCVFYAFTPAAHKR